MTRNEYNLTGILGAKASAQNARALHHLDVTIGGHAPIYAIAERIAKKAMNAKRPIDAVNPIVWTLESKHVQLRQSIIAKLGEKYIYAKAQGLDKILIAGLHTPEFK